MDSMHLPIGTLLQAGKYKIVRFIGSGGFGCTYEAEHVMLEKRVAIKEFFVRDFCNRDEATAHVTVGTVSKRGLVKKLRGKFIDEARALSHMQHPHIVFVSDVFEENGTAYYVMDYIDGLSLLETVKRNGPLPESKALKYIRQAAEALKYVHAHNRLHLDVKPSNIMINERDDAVLIDFGASKQYDEVDGENTSTLMGKTPGYAPLEQIGNDVVKFMPATDIYALGATLYKLLTGITPISANLLASGEELAPLPHGISKNVKDAITAAMQINKLKRPQRVEAFLAILGSTAAATSPEEATILDYEKPKEVPPQPKQPSVTKADSKDKTAPKKDSSSTVLKIIVVIFIVFFVGFILKAISRSMNEKTVKNETTEEVKEVKTEDNLRYVQNSIQQYAGITFTYTGNLNKAGNPEGKGTGVYPDGTYVGEYSNGCREGQATYTTKEGKNTFKGKFSDNQYAEGRLTVDDGSYFEGSFENNEPYTGIWYNKDGSLYGKVQKGNITYY